MNTTSETFANPWFSATFLWRDGMLNGIDLSPDARQATEPRSAHGPVLARIVAEYDQLETDCWPELSLDWSALTPFSRLVLENLRRHALKGTWTTYGRLATLCGSPRAARAVGGVMARNPWPLLYPCHRVLAGDGGLGGFGPGLALKKTLLTLEKAFPVG